MPVVVQAGFGVVVLPREAQVDGGGNAVAIGILQGCDAAEGVGFPLPDGALSGIGGEAGCAEVIGLQVHEFVLAGAVVRAVGGLHDSERRAVIVVQINGLYGSGGVGFGE